MSKKRGQVSFEYLSIVTFGIVIILIAVYTFFSYSMNSNDQFIASRIEETGYNIVENIETLYYTTGEGSSIHIKVNFPENVKAVYLVDNGGESEFVIEYSINRGRSEAIFFTPIFLNASEDYGAGKTFFLDGEQHSGAVKIKLTNVEGGVYIEESI